MHIPRADDDDNDDDYNYDYDCHKVDDTSYLVASNNVILLYIDYDLNTIVNEHEQLDPSDQMSTKNNSRWWRDGNRGMEKVEVWKRTISTAAGISLIISYMT